MTMKRAKVKKTRKKIQQMIVIAELMMAIRY